MSTAISTACPRPASGSSRVYGPWGRPDMAPFLFHQGHPGRPADQGLQHGQMERDFTYIDDVAEGVCRLSTMCRAPTRAGAATTRTRAPVRRPTGSTISATTGRSSCWTSSRCWNAAWAGSRSRNCCRCSRATCPPPPPISRISPRDRLSPDHADRNRRRAFRPLVPRFLRHALISGTARRSSGQ